MTIEPDRAAVERVRLELLGRKFMVSMLSLIAVFIGISVMLTGAPNFIEDWFSPWSRYVVGGIAFIFGLLASLGGLADDTRVGWVAQAVGLLGVAIFYLGMAIVYAVLVYFQGVEIVGPGEPLSPEDTGRGYVPFVYVGLALMAGTPFVTTLRVGRPAD